MTWIIWAIFWVQCFKIKEGIWSGLGALLESRLENNDSIPWVEKKIGEIEE